MSELELARGAGPANAVEASIRNLQSGEIAIYNSIQGTDEESADLTLTAISNAEPISDHLGEVISLQHVIVEIAEAEAEVHPNGTVIREVGFYPRITLIDADGSSYVANSTPVLNELERVFAVRGRPHTWKTPYNVVVTEQGTGTRKWFKLAAAPRTAAKK